MNAEAARPPEPSPTPAGEELNRRIAERLGWLINQLDEDEMLIWKHSREEQAEVSRPWSASKEAIERDLLPRLTEEQWLRFIMGLTSQMDLPFEAFRWTVGGFEGEGTAALMFLLTATPSQLCRAWLFATEGSAK